MPTKVETYVHRIGRTARAGRKGRSCTLITEGRRVYMKKVIKDAQEKQNNTTTDTTPLIQSRIVPPNVIQHFSNKISSLEIHIEQVLSAEHVAKIDRLAQMEVTKAENLITHKDEIMSRPAKVWPVTKHKLHEEDESHTHKPSKKVSEPGTGQHRMTRKKRRARAAQAELKRFQEEEEREQQQLQNDDDESNTTNQNNTPHHHNANVKPFKEKRIKKLSEEDAIMDPEKIVKQKQRNKKAKVEADNNKNNDNTIGDGSLFSEDKVTFSNKKKGNESNTSSTVKSSYEFRGYDPSQKFGKGGRKGHHQFKSKSKFKRKRK